MTIATRNWGRQYTNIIETPLFFKEPGYQNHRRVLRTGTDNAAILPPSLHSPIITITPEKTKGKRSPRLYSIVSAEELKSISERLLKADLQKSEKPKDLSDFDKRKLFYSKRPTKNPSLKGTRMSKVDFTGVNSLAKINFRGSDLSLSSFQSQNLFRSIFNDTKLIGSNFRNADLRQSKFLRANLAAADLRGADLRRASFSKANLRGALIDSNTRLQRADFTQADLRGIDLDLINLKDCILNGVNLAGEDLSERDFSKIKLNSAILNNSKLNKADLSKADLSNGSLRNVQLKNANLKLINLSGADLSGADLTGADLTGAKLEGANLRGAKLRNVNLQSANISGADLSGADLRSTDVDFENWEKGPRNTNLCDVNASGAIFNKAKINIDQSGHLTLSDGYFDNASFVSTEFHLLSQRYTNKTPHGHNEESESKWIGQGERTVEKRTNLDKKRRRRIRNKAKRELEAKEAGDENKNKSDRPSPSSNKIKNARLQEERAKKDEHKEALRARIKELKAQHPSPNLLKQKYAELGISTADSEYLIKTWADYSAVENAILNLDIWPGDIKHHFKLSQDIKISDSPKEKEVNNPLKDSPEKQKLYYIEELEIPEDIAKQLIELKIAPKDVLSTLKSGTHPQDLKYVYKRRTKEDELREKASVKTKERSAAGKKILDQLKSSGSVDIIFENPKFYGNPELEALNEVVGSNR